MRSAKLKVVFVTTLAVISASYACASLEHGASNRREFNNSECVYIDGEVRETDASFKGKATLQWQYSNYRPKLHGENFRAISRIADQAILGTARGNIWALDDDHLRKLGSIANHEIKDLEFQTPMLGILLARPLGTGDANTPHIGSIFRTTDGGKSWSVVQTLTGVIFERVVSKGPLFWAVGRTIENDAKQTSHLLLSSTDTGSTWENISSELNIAASDELGFVNDYLTNVDVGTNGSLTVLSLRGRIYELKERYGQWTLVGGLPAEPPQTGIREFGKASEGCYWVAGGSLADEGTWGMIAVQSKVGSWQRLRLHGFFFADLLRLQSGELLAVGAKDTLNHLDSLINASRMDQGRTAVVLKSEDEGRNWQSVYESREDGTFEQIQQIDDSRFVIISESGDLILLNR